MLKNQQEEALMSNRNWWKNLYTKTTNDSAARLKIMNFLGLVLNQKKFGDFFRIRLNILFVDNYGKKHAVPATMFSRKLLFAKQGENPVFPIFVRNCESQRVNGEMLPVITDCKILRSGRMEKNA
ncbi:hypothetical protein KKC32_00920 [Patescibacteria group bacterium]|nr:hypothetical protein [Patescibacteria group bacterium]